MENDEKEDLLLELTESEDEVFEKEEIDYYIEKKILDYIQSEKPSEKPRKKTIIFITTCLFMFLTSSILIIALPIYFKQSSVAGITTYSKMVILSLVNAVVFILAHVVGFLFKRGNQTPTKYSLSLSDILKVSLLLSIGSISIFWLADGSYVSCHLKDPLKGCAVVFSLLLYFVFSRKKMSLERTFCAITIIVGVFISVDFGLCDKFQCNGNSNLTEITPKLHFLYVVFYILAHGIWVLHFVLVEICWTSFKVNSSNLDVSVLSKVTSSLNSGTEVVKPSIQSLSLICQEEQEEQLTGKKESLQKLKPEKSFFCLKSQRDKRDSRKGLENSLPQRNQLSVPDFNKFPLTSTPNNEVEHWNSWTTGQCLDVALWQHITCCLVILGMCWIPTLSVFQSGREKLLVDVLNDVIDSFWCHFYWGSDSKCLYLPTITVLVSLSYVILILSSIKVLEITQSTVTVISAMMLALPVSSLFWTLFRLKGGTVNILEFSPEITGEAVCAILGLPIIGIGILLLMKSHIREFALVV